jgi:A/G-specific adenine glycosylase
MKSEYFANVLLAWHDQHGRKNLPWQQNITPYRVWVSEIMLQQTQVTVVISYYEKFIQKFPTVEKLACTKTDEVLHLWTGLGYYARARNLHKTAKIISEQFNGTFPDDLATLQSLPGIGRSTAGAILAIAYNKATPILDGNVKRVLTRYQAIKGWPNHAPLLNELWLLAEKYTPKHRSAQYTQAIMDLGATLCTRHNPACNHCPLQKTCKAHLQGCELEFPQLKSRPPLPIKNIKLLILYNSKGEILLEKRPPLGIWGGLWSLPECAFGEDIADHCQKYLACKVENLMTGKSFRHTFSHFHLNITPVSAKISHLQTRIMDSDHFLWYKLTDKQKVGLASPIKKLLVKYC